MKYFFTVLFLMLSFTASRIYSQGTPIWLNSAGNSEGDNAGRTIALDSAGNSYVISSFTGKIKFGPIELTSKGAKDILIISYKPDGSVAWAKNFGGLDDDEPKSIVCNEVGTLSICGTFTGNVDFGGGLIKTSGAFDGFILRLSPSGEFIYAKKIGGPSDDLVNGIAVDESGNSYVVGTFSDTLGFPGSNVPTLQATAGTDVFLIKYSNTGVPKWAKRAGGVSYQEGLSIVYDKHGFVNIAGSFFTKIEFPGGSATDLTSTGNYDIFIAQYDTSGIPRWSQRIGGGNDDQPRGLAVSDSGMVYLTGTYTGLAGFSGSTITLSKGGMFIVQYTIDGIPQWANRVGNNSSDIGNAVAVDKNGNVFVVGDFYGITNFNLSNVPDITSAGKADMILACYNTSGLILWAMRAGGAEIDNGNSIAVNIQGDLFITGSYRETADFSGGTLADITSSGGSDVFTIRYNIPKFSVIGFVSLNGSPFEGVTITDGTRTSVTGQGGLFELKNVPNGTYTVVPSKLGYEFLPVSQQVTVKDITPQSVIFAAQFVLLPPVLVMPPNEATKVPVSAGLEWQATVGATLYHLQISTLPVFTTVILDDSTLTTLTTAANNLDVATDYFWRVRASDGTHWSAWSEVRRFVTAEAIPGQVLLNSPQNQSTAQPTDPLFTWKVLENAANYHFQLSIASDFTALHRDDSSITATAKIVSGLELNKRYYWRVRGFVEGVWGAWSDVWNFQTKITDAVEESTDNLYPIELKVFPSIVTDGNRLSVTYPSHSVGNLTIVSILGEKKFESISKETNGRMEIDVSNWTSGMYHAIFKIGKRTASSSFMILK